MAVEHLDAAGLNIGCGNIELDLVARTHKLKVDMFVENVAQRIGVPRVEFIR